MGLFRNRRIARQRDGTYAVRLPDEERELLTSVTGQLRALLEDAPGDPALRRLFPTAYHDDPERDRGYQVLAREELLDRRRAALATVDATARATRVDEDELARWMRAVNDVRLVLGTRLDVDEEMGPVPADHPDAPALALYEYLGFLLHEIVDALSGGLPEPTDDAG